MNKNSLEQLSGMTEIVADTGEIELIEKLKPVDATTNPSLLFKAAQLEKYSSLVKNAISFAKELGGNEDKITENTMDILSVNFGVEILKIIPGLVSTEIDARLSFDKNGTLKKVNRLIELYTQKGIDVKKRVLFKIAGTWEGLEAMKVLESKNIRCNITLVFSLWQAAVAAEYKATLISPFVGRITDWYKEKNKLKELPPIELDEGIRSVKNIYYYYTTFKYKTIIMGASFRSKEQVLALAGAEKLTVSPKILLELKNQNKKVERALYPNNKDDKATKKLEITQENFRWALNSNPVATDKLAEGIRCFAKDTDKLEAIIKNEIKK